MFKKVGIVGLGLIGGSLAKAFKNRLGVKSIVAANRHEDVLRIALAEGVITECSTDITEIFCGCDIVFICTPVSAIAGYAEKLSHFVDKSCIITDVGSTKASIHKELANLADKICYIGGHPMTGSEKFRYQASKEFLFENAYYILTPAKNAPEAKISLLKEALAAIGAIPLVLEPDIHDYTAAAISHVPHIIAAALVNSVKELDSGSGYMHRLAAGGFRDTTRIAASSPEMWKSICEENSENILRVLDNLEAKIAEIRKDIKNSDSGAVSNFFATAKQYRDSFEIVVGSNQAGCEISVDVQDKPGSIAIIAVVLSSNGINITNMGILNSRESDDGVIYLAFRNEDDRRKAASLLGGIGYSVTEK